MSSSEPEERDGQGERRPARRGRLAGVDLARTLAITGMVMVHFGPKPVPETLPGSLYGLTDGRASVLFVLLAGVGVSFLAGRGSGGEMERPQALRRRGRARLQLVFRASLLLPLGLWLQGLENVVLVVILQYYAVYFLIAALALGLPDRWVMALGAAALAGGPFLYLWGAEAHPEWYFAAPISFADEPGRIFRDLLLSGFYPVVTWTGPLLVGMWVGGMDLRSRRVRLALIGAGVAVAAAAALFSSSEPVGGRPEFSDLLTGEPHSQMPLWMLGAIGTACATLGAALLLAEWLPKAISPLAAAGQLALSVYVGHALLLNYFPDLLSRQTVPAAALYTAAFMALVTLLCVVWRMAFSRGPLEAVLAAPQWLLGAARSGK